MDNLLTNDHVGVMLERYEELDGDLRLCIDRALESNLFSDTSLFVIMNMHYTFGQPIHKIAQQLNKTMGEVAELLDEVKENIAAHMQGYRTTRHTRFVAVPSTGLTTIEYMALLLEGRTHPFDVPQSVYKEEQLKAARTRKSHPLACECCNKELVIYESEDTKQNMDNFIFRSNRRFRPIHIDAYSREVDFKRLGMHKQKPKRKGCD